jgi:pepF/M3 family oligoendopeptidase
VSLAHPPAEPPHWDVADVFPGLASRPFAAAHERLRADQAPQVALYDRQDVRGGPPRPEREPIDDETVAAFDTVLTDTNRLLDHVRTVSAYLYAHVSTDARDDRAAGLQSEIQTELTGLGQLSKRFDAWVERLGVDELVRRSEVAHDHAFPLQRAAGGAHHQMSEVEEHLAGELRLSGSSAWQRLHRDISARLVAEVVGADGEVETLPMSVVRGMAFDADHARRRAAYDGELDAWEEVSVPLAAALNGAKGEHHVLNRRRGWSDDLEPALFTNNVDRATLDAMTEAVVESLPSFRRYLRDKARLLGHRDALPWWDLFAPVGGGGHRWAWPDAVEHVRDAFGTFSPQLAALVDRASSERWIDAEPRDGKATGAFCLPVRDDESRVRLNFDGSPNSVQTLAHELGHAYHNTNLGRRTPMQRRTPMALAETASIFCETIVVTAGLAAAPDEQRLSLLDTHLQNVTQIVVDIHSRFLFELELCRRREQRTLSVDELCGAMRDAQRTAYGDGHDAATLHPYMWAVKGHYFTPFYNWPYTFGLLFGVGLYARYLDDAASFRSGYDDLLASTGLGRADELADRFGIDVRSAEFWRSSLAVLGDRADQFSRLVAEAATG